MAWGLGEWAMLIAAAGAVIAAVCVFAMLFMRRVQDANGAVREQPIKALSLLVPESPGRQAERVLQQVDPAFTLEQFEHHVRGIWMLMAQSMSAGTLEPITPWLSDGLLQRIRIELRLHGGSASTEPFQTDALAAVAVVGHDRDEAYHSLRVRLTITPPGAARTERHQQWTFLRRVGATTPKSGLTEGRCPRCGAPLALAATLRCAHCDAVINSGAHDWVLVDVSDGAATLHRRPDLFDLGGLRAGDPALCSEELEDRAAFAFWRWHEAMAGLEPSLLPTIATPELCSEVEEALRSGTSGTRRRSAATFALRALARAESEEAHVEVRWVEQDAAENLRPERRVLVLRRRLGSTTARDAGLSTARCSNCMGPLPESGARLCGYCGATFDHDWQLAALVPWKAWSEWLTAQRAKQTASGIGARLERLSASDRLEVIEALAAVARADGAVPEAERDFVLRLGTALAVADEEVQRALQGSELPSLSRRRLGRDVAQAALAAMVELAVLDGKADLRERKLLERVARELDATADLERLMAVQLRQLLVRHRERTGGDA